MILEGSAFELVDNKFIKEKGFDCYDFDEKTYKDFIETFKIT